MSKLVYKTENKKRKNTGKAVSRKQAARRQPEKSRLEISPANEAQDAFVNNLWSEFISSRRPIVKNELVLKYYYAALYDFISWIRKNIPGDISDRSQIDYEAVRNYVNFLRKDDLYLHEKSNHKIEILRAFFHVVLKEKDPFRRVMLLRGFEQINILPLDWDSICRICNNVNVDWETQTLILTGMYGGISLRDSCLLEWKDIDLDKEVIIFEKNKLVGISSSKIINIIPDLKCTFKNIGLQKRKGFVLPSVSKTYLNNPDDVYRNIFNLFDLVDISPFEETVDSKTGEKSLKIIYDYRSFRLGYLENVEEKTKTIENGK